MLLFPVVAVCAVPTVVEIIVTFTALLIYGKKTHYQAKTSKNSQEKEG